MNWLDGQNESIKKGRTENFHGVHKIKEFDEDFNLYYSKFLDSVKNSSNEVLLQLKKYIQTITENKFFLTDLEVQLLLQKPFLWPALNASIRNNVFLGFLADKNCHAPQRNIFADGLMIIQSAYCDAFLTDDVGLLSNHVNNILPKAEAIEARIFLEKYFK